MLQRNEPGFLHEIRQSLYTAVLSDVLDELGLRDQAMPPSIRPLDENLTLAGFARTGLYREVFHAIAGENPYELEIALVDDLKPDDVAVFGCCGSRRIAPWGELLSTASRARKAAGCVTDGLVRDVKQIRAMRFPVFHGGIGPLDTRGRARMVERDTPVECAGVAVRSGPRRLPRSCRDSARPPPVPIPSAPRARPGRRSAARVPSAERAGRSRRSLSCRAPRACPRRADRPGLRAGPPRRRPR